MSTTGASFRRKLLHNNRSFQRGHIPESHAIAEINPIAPNVARSELYSILATDRFRRSHRSSRLFQAIVEHSLGGRAGDLKEYALGVEVFDRGTCFDPRVDPIVRVELGRLRRKLKEYYENEGIDSPIRIVVPLREHVAVFSRNNPVQPASPRAETAKGFLAAAPGFLAKKSPFLLLP